MLGIDFIKANKANKAAVERAIEQHQFEPLVRGRDRFEPAGPERRIHFPAPVCDGHRHAAAPAGLADIARIGKRAQEISRLGFRPVPLRGLPQLRPLAVDQDQLPRHATISAHPEEPRSGVSKDQQKSGQLPKGAARLAILHCACRVPNERYDVKAYFSYLVISARLNARP